VSDTHDPYQALRFGSFRLLLTGIFIAGLGERMIDVALGWELYQRTGSALVLGGVGLAIVIPVIVLSLPAGHIIDRFNRKYIVIISQVALALVSLGLTALSFERGSLVLIYGCLVLYGCASAFNSPAAATLVPQVVDERAFENAATWDSSVGQLASVLGPAAGGLLIALLGGATLVYAINAGVIMVFVCLLFFLREIRPAAPTHETTTLQSLGEGLKFLRSTQVILASITLDMFAVLLGGATALLPIYASDILHVGPAGLGWLRAAPSIGALVMSFVIAHTPPFKRAGRTLLLAVTGFGLATIVFGISRSFWLSLLMLGLLGGFDNISVVIRSTLLMTRTPNALLGRISAINFIFIGASNELGGFESGLAAQFFGPVIAVAGGGIGTILVALAVALIWPEMRRLGAMTGVNREVPEPLQEQEKTPLP
jgi:MFS family permease